MGITSADIANSTANDAQRSAEDNRALLDWAFERIEALEALLAVIPSERPELPSESKSRRWAEYMNSPEYVEAMQRQAEANAAFNPRFPTLMQPR